MWQPFYVEQSSLKVKAKRYFETSGTVHPVASHSRRLESSRLTFLVDPCMWQDKWWRCLVGCLYEVEDVRGGWLMNCLMHQSFKFKLILMQVSFHLVLPLTTEICHLWDNVNRTNIHPLKFTCSFRQLTSLVWISTGGRPVIRLPWSCVRWTGITGGPPSYFE